MKSDNLFRLACSSIIDPESNKIHSHYDNGNIRSLRDARVEGILSPVNPNVLEAEKKFCINTALVFGFVALCALCAIVTGALGLIMLDQGQYLTAGFIAVWFSLLTWNCYQASKIPQ